jgi:hypothetical protein
MSDTFDPLRAALTGYFQAGFVKPGPGSTTVPFLPTAYDNATFSQPKGAAWARFAIRTATRSNNAVGRDEQRTLGFISLQVFIPEDGGTRAAAVAADKMAALFDNQTIAISPGKSVIFRTVSQNTVGRLGDGLFQVNVTCDFQFDEIAA